MEKSKILMTIIIVLFLLSSILFIVTPASDISAFVYVTSICSIGFVGAIVNEKLK